MSKERAGRRGALRKAVFALAVLLLAAALFFAGFFVRTATLPQGAKTLLWMWSEVDAHYFYDVEEKDFWNAAIGGAEGLFDEYSEYYTAEEYGAVQDSYAGLQNGVGLNLFSASNLVLRVAIGSPLFFACEEGKTVEEGMYLTGAGTAEDSLQTIEDGSSAAEVLASLSEQERVVLRFSAQNDARAADSFTLSVSAEEYTESYVLYACGGRAFACIHGADGARWEDVSGHVTLDEAVTGDTAYIRIVRFAGDAAEAFAYAARQFKEDGASALLLDLRNNGGGRMDILQSVASYLLRDADSSAEIVQTARFKDGTEQEYRARGNYFAEYFGDAAVYAAANGNSASASEALLGAMYSYGTLSYADVYLTKLGDAAARTYGKGIMQTTYTSGNGALKLTTAQIYWPNGTCIHGRGVTEEDADESGCPHAVSASSNADAGNAALSAILASIAA